jgi:hypothetical protein
MERGGDELGREEHSNYGHGSDREREGGKRGAHSDCRGVLRELGEVRLGANRRREGNGGRGGEEIDAVDVELPPTNEE